MTALDSLGMQSVHFCTPIQGFRVWDLGKYVLIRITTLSIRGMQSSTAELMQPVLADNRRVLDASGTRVSRRQTGNPHPCSYLMGDPKPKMSNCRIAVDAKPKCRWEGPTKRALRLCTTIFLLLG